jgi:hypothetical protein
LLAHPINIAMKGHRYCRFRKMRSGR